MDGNAFDIGADLNSKRIRYFLSNSLWLKFGSASKILDFPSWKSIKYLNENGTNLNSAISKIPDNQGGLYLFFVPCPVLPGLTEFPLYIGRAQLTENQNLRKRVKEYFQHYMRDDERPKIYRMLKLWGPELMVAYHEFEENSDTIDLEKRIINSTLFPMNDQIPDKELKAAIKAFEL